MQKLIIILLTASLFIAVAYIFLRPKSNVAPSTPLTDQVTTASATPVQNSWQTYTNKNGYSVQYPSDWIVREYPGTQTGAGFQPKSLPADPANEFITVNISPKVSPMMDSFEKYCRVAASNEIQGYQSLVSLDPVTTTSNQIGYTTTWKVSGPGMMGKSSTSTPITYFDLPGVKPSSTLQVFLNDTKYQDIYQSMLKTVVIK